MATETTQSFEERAVSGGRIVMTLANGGAVRRIEERRHQGKGRTPVASDAGTPGWMFSVCLDHLAIDGSRLKSAPMRPRRSGE